MIEQKDSKAHGCDKRTLFRKDVTLQGYVESRIGALPIVIHNISEGGLGFSLVGKNMPHKNASIVVTFTLDDHKKTYIETDVRVRHCNGNYCGGEIAKNGMYSAVVKAIGFYLRVPQM